MSMIILPRRERLVCVWKKAGSGIETGRQSSPAVNRKRRMLAVPWQICWVWIPRICSSLHSVQGRLQHPAFFKVPQPREDVHLWLLNARHDPEAESRKQCKTKATVRTFDTGRQAHSHAPSPILHQEHDSCWSWANHQRAGKSGIPRTVKLIDSSAQF